MCMYYDLHQHRVLSAVGRCGWRFSFQPGRSHTTYHLLTQLNLPFNRLGRGFCVVGVESCTHNGPFLDKTEHLCTPHSYHLPLCL